MKTLSPKDAVMMAEQIYNVQNTMMEERINRLFGRSESGIRDGALDGLFTSGALGDGGTGYKPDVIQLKYTAGASRSRAKWLTRENVRGLFVKGEGLQYRDDLFLIFRGTDDGYDWLTDFRIGMQTGATGYLTHIGFDHAFRDMAPTIEKFLEEHAGYHNVHCIGHSLGGELAAHWLKKRGKIVRLYTFGAPRVGSLKFAKSVTKDIGKDNIYRVYNQYDPVPCTPPFPYAHAPYLPFQKTQKYGLSFFRGAEKSHPHSIKNYKAAIGEKSWDEILEKPCVSLGKNFFTGRKGVSYKKGALDRVNYVAAQIGRIPAVLMGGVSIAGLSAWDKLVFVYKYSRGKTPSRKALSQEQYQALVDECEEMFGQRFDTGEPIDWDLFYLQQFAKLDADIKAALKDAY